MTVSELIALLQSVKAEHGDLEVGYHSNPGAGSFASIESADKTDLDVWIRDPRAPCYDPQAPERWVIDLYNGNPG